MVQNIELINLFVRNFIEKDKREMCYSHLTGKNRHRLTNKLNHRWDEVLNMALLHETGKREDGYSHIQSILQLKDTELCYIISGESEVDGTILPFAEAFARVKSSFSGTLLVNMAATKLFLKTEYMGGRTPSFWGIASPALP